MNLKTNLVSYWKFDGDATDSHGTNNGTVSGATVTTSGKIRSAYDFGLITNDRYVDVGGQSVYNFVQNTGVFSIQLWYNPTSVASNHYIFGNANTDSHKGFWIGLVSSKYQMVLANGVGNQYWSFNSATSTKTGWTHLVFTGDGDNVRLYVDGVLDSNTGVRAQAKPSGDSTNTLTIGKIFSGGSVSANGLLDEPAIWSRALSADEVKLLFYNGRGWQYPFRPAMFGGGI